MEKLKLAAGMTGEQKRYAVEAALLLGFQTETATLPVFPLYSFSTGLSTLPYSPAPESHRPL